MNIIPGPVRAYLPLIKVGVAALVLGSVAWYFHHRGVIGERQKWEAKVSEARQERIDEYESQIKDYKGKLATEQGRTAALTTVIGGMQTQTERLSIALSRASLVNRETDANGVAVVRLSKQFRLCVSAATLGTESALADCATVRVPNGATP